MNKEERQELEYYGNLEVVIGVWLFVKRTRTGQVNITIERDRKQVPLHDIDMKHDDTKRKNSVPQRE